MEGRCGRCSPGWRRRRAAGCLWGTGSTTALTPKKGDAATAPLAEKLLRPCRVLHCADEGDANVVGPAGTRPSSTFGNASGCAWINRAGYSCARAVASRWCSVAAPIPATATPPPPASPPPPPPPRWAGRRGGPALPTTSRPPPRKPSSRSTDADAAAYLWSPGCARASCGTPLAMRGGASVMTIGPDLVAQILRLHEVEKWRVGTIARQLHVHRDVVRRVLGGNSAPVHGSPLRASRIDVLRPFILETLTKFPALTAARL